MLALEAFSIFDVRKWPADKDVLKDSYIDGIKLLYKTYKIFYAEEETEEMVLEQWEDLKAEINVPTLRTLSFHQLWANMLVQYADEYALVLRLVVISLLIPADTSECERIFFEPWLSSCRAVEAPSRHCRGAVEALSRPCLSSLSSYCRVPVEFLSSLSSLTPCAWASSSVEVCRAVE